MSVSDVAPAATTIVTAADESYFRTLWQMLLSAERWRLPDVHPFVVFDLGMRDPHRRLLEQRFGWCRVERFPFDDYPPHLRRLVSCAWKPVAIDRVAARSGGPVLWLDSATLFQGPLTPIVERIERDGLFTLVGQSPLVRWCHPETLRAMAVPEGDLGKRCRFGGAVGLDVRRPVVRDLLTAWRECALDPACIDPPGASRDNHRFDQAVLTNLVYGFERERGLRLRDEAVDISACDPVRWITTRNKVVPWWPFALDPLSRLYHAVYKRLDRLVLRAKRRFA